VTTDSKHSLPVAPNLLKRNFQADAANKVWTGDITCCWTECGWARRLDADRRRRGYSVAPIDTMAWNVKRMFAMKAA
jgi:transposase InsO family protein